MGRTELQEAVPITLGAEFSAFGEALVQRPLENISSVKSGCGS